MIHIHKQQWVGLVIVLAMTFLLLLFSVWIVSGNPNPAGFGDSIEYLVFADFFHGSFVGVIPEYLRDYFLHTRLPPLFPLLVGVSGGNINNVAPAYWFTLIPLVISSLLCAWWMARETKNLLVGSLLTAATFISPGVFLLALNPVSEPLFMLMVLAAFILAPHALLSKTSMLAFALVISLAPLCRMAGLALVFGSVLWIWIRHAHPVLFRIMISILMLAPALIWMIFRKSYPVEFAYTDQLSTELILKTFGDWVGLFFARPLALHQAFTEIFDPKAETWLYWALAPLTILAVVGWGHRLRSLQLDAMVLLPYVGLIWIWPFPSEATRFLIVVLPMIMVCAWEGINFLWNAAWKTGCKIASLEKVEYLRSYVLPAILLSISLGTFFIGAAYRMMLILPVEFEPFRRYASFFQEATVEDAKIRAELGLRIINAYDAARSIINKSECLATVQGPVAWYATHAEVAIKRIPYPVPQDVHPEEVFKKCHYIMVTGIITPQLNEPLLYPLQQVARFTRPVFVSMLRVRDKEILAAALLETLDQQN